MFHKVCPGLKYDRNSNPQSKFSNRAVIFQVCVLSPLQPFLFLNLLDGSFTLICYDFL